MSRKAAALWNFFFLNVGFLISLVNGILIIPLYLHYMDSGLYGAWLATGNILSWITMVDPGVSGVLLQRVSYAIGKRDKSEVGLAITSGIIISSLLFLFSLLFGISLSFFISNITKISPRYNHDIIGAFRIAIWGTAFNLLAFTFSNIVLAYQKTKIHGVALNSINISAIALTIILLVAGKGIFSLAYAALFRGLATLLYSVILSITLIKKDNVDLVFDMEYFKSFSKIFSVTFANRMFDTIANNIDLVLISRYLGSNAVTALDLSRRPIKLVNGIANNVTISMLPGLAHLFGSNDREKIKTTIVSVGTIVLWLSGFIMGGFILFGQSLITNWVGPQFWIGNGNNIIVCISLFILSIGYNFSNITHSMGEMKRNSIIYLIRNISYIALLFCLVKLGNVSGVLIAFLIPTFILMFFFTKRIFKSGYLAKEDINAIVREFILELVVIGVCITISYLISKPLSFIEIVFWGAGYFISYLVFFALFSPTFKRSVLTMTSKFRMINT
jgi:O-antigen/teichoic acid export membrane protein